jgi:mono/diheme cytochrome c family protein
VTGSPSQGVHRKLIITLAAEHRCPEHSQGEEGMLNLLLGITALLATTSLTQAQTPIERGSCLVNGVLTCGNCHTPRGPGGIFAMDRQLSGGPQEWDRPTYKVRGANITPDKETGIGNWSEADIKRAITNGTRPNGTPLAPIMPYSFYKVALGKKPAGPTLAAYHGRQEAVRAL